LAPSTKIKTKKGEKISFTRNPEKEREIKKRDSKNELVINAKEERRRREKNKQTNKMNGQGKHGEKKGKTGGTTTELPTNTPALSEKQNKCKAKNQ